MKPYAINCAGCGWVTTTEAANEVFLRGKKLLICNYCFNKIGDQDVRTVLLQIAAGKKYRVNPKPVPNPKPKHQSKPKKQQKIITYYNRHKIIEVDFATLPVLPAELKLEKR